ncbi:MAG: hypothetical protein WBR26_05165 [Candidatus Acidiferrum sp.]
MRSWRNANSLVRLCCGPVLKRVLCGLCVAASFATAQTIQPKNAAKTDSAHLANEFTLAGLRPGRDSGNRALQLYGKTSSSKKDDDGQLLWRDVCNNQSLTIELDRNGKIQELRATLLQPQNGSTVDCHPVPPKWRTGHGLHIWDPTTKVLQLYGPPDSKSPSTRNGQPLELWYYAFDWAGPDVPQVMEVLCTREKDGQPGRVVEITLAAPSL